MKHLKAPLCGRSARYFCYLVLVGLGAATASATITVTNPANIAVAAAQVGTAGNTEEIADVTTGLAGASIPYNEGGTNAFSCCGGRSGSSYGIHNLNDGDVGIGNATDGLFAIPDFGAGAVVMDLAGGNQKVCSIAIYHGYGNRNQGVFTLRDGAGNVIGEWSSDGNNVTEAYWMTFPNPVMTDGLVIDVSPLPGSEHPTPSFREVQVFCGVTEARFSPGTGQPLFPFGNLNVFKQYAVGFSEAISVGDTVEIDLLFTTIEFGGSLDASFDAAFGFEFGLCLGGNANYDMGFSPQVILPDLYPSEIPIPMTINPGKTADSHFTTVFPPLGQMYADLIVHMEADVNAEACVFGCFDPLSFLNFPLTTCDFPPLQPSDVKLFNLSTRCDPTITAQKYCAIELASFNRDGQSNIARMLNVGADDRFEFFAEPYKEFALGVSSGKSFIANPGNNTISITGTNPFPPNSPVRVSSTGTLPLGLKKSKIYYTTAGGSLFSLSNSPNGAPVSIMSGGNGSHSLKAPVVDEDPDPLSGKYGSLAIAAPTISTNSADPALRHLQTATSLRGQGAEDVIGVGIDIAAMAADFIFPPIVPPLADSGSLGPIGWNYTLAALDVGPAVQLQMDYEFTWDLVVTEITFTKPVNLYTGGDAAFVLNGNPGGNGAGRTKLSQTGASDRAFHLTNCGPNALPLIYLCTDLVPGTGDEAGRMVPKEPQDAVGVSI